MKKYKAAPISELSIAVQFGGPLFSSPEVAIRIYDQLRSQYPKIELKHPIATLGGAGPLGSFPIGVGQLVQVTNEEINPRYWFSSDDEYLLVQVQSDLIGLNWRKRTLPGELPKFEYPGFDEMAKRFSEIVDLVFKISGTKESPPIAAINLYYDNVWPFAPSKHGIADIFAFWNKLGIKMTIGPDVRLAVKLDDEVLGPMARVDLNALAAAALVDEKPIPVARLVLSALANPKNYSDVAIAFDKLHTHVTGLFEKLTTEGTRASWQ